MDELGVGITDQVHAQMVECPPIAPETCVQPMPEDVSPTAASRDATIEQTGAGPPPEG